MHVYRIMQAYTAVYFNLRVYSFESIRSLLLAHRVTVYNKGLPATGDMPPAMCYAL